MWFVQPSWQVSVSKSSSSSAENYCASLLVNAQATDGPPSVRVSDTLDTTSTVEKLQQIPTIAVAKGCTAQPAMVLQIQRFCCSCARTIALHWRLMLPIDTLVLSQTDQ